ncbi:YggS family pyridoxal phosphate-dependent enzyme [Desulfatitalea alkaliphila]|uniref:Pyridoxal phosphate homeostasis protein n=1 Tax=Desulfatitalea alkaliphila TaxID=2929485 RepID=A0AA41R173_9BACT|nr:YggS family pyridoxal phosphate-dependent enzyme [Desulfatitalea alkaliphila]MCJ8500494.1 YggS family pyridoxal phosphate-dependent enzyme [Desulfatitalea alkaliphila]
MNSTIADRLHEVQARMAMIARRCGRRPEEIQLVAVGKTHRAEAIEAAMAAGATIIGENYVQEARDKFAALSHRPAAWHFIGHLQTNKAKYAVRLFELIHTVDSLKLAEELNRQAGKAGKIQRVLIQVNTGGEKSKSGVTAEQAPALARELSGLEHLKVEGLMAIPPYFNDPEASRPHFAALRELRDRIAALAIPGIEMQALSMGMTGDFEAAIEEGATLVRIGSAIFGARA